MKTIFDLTFVSCYLLQLKCVFNDCMNLCLWIMAFFIILYFILIKKINVHVAYAKRKVTYATLFYD